MRIDCSEIKTYRECGRKHQLSSRNAYHLRPITPNMNLQFGTLMHEALHAMYLGGSFDKILASTLKELTDPQLQRVMTTLLCGYYEQVLPKDLEEYKIIDVEWGFRITASQLGYEPIWVPVYDEHGEMTGEVEELILAGSVDMIALKYEDNTIWGFEHKSAKSFANPVYTHMNEQPRIYTEALDLWVKQRNEDRYNRWLSDCQRIADFDMEDGTVEPPAPEPYKLGGLLINQNKKTVKFFQHERTVCRYSPKEREQFMKSYLHTCKQIVENPITLPEPGSMKCMMCDYRAICEHYGFNELDLVDIADEFIEEFEVRDVDHLDEKQERYGADAEE